MNLIQIAACIVSPSIRRERAYLKQEKKLFSNINFSENFDKEYRYILKSALQDLKSQGFWEMGLTDEKEYTEKLVDSFLESIKLNGFKNVVCLPYKGELCFVDKDNTNEFISLNLIREGNVKRNLEFFERCKSNLEIAKEFFKY